MATEKDWRDSKTVTECLSHLCLSETMSDVVFTFPDSGARLHAHRVVLGMRSAVFEAMFYGSLAEKGQEVKIEDGDPEAFEVLLRYIYMDTADLKESTALLCLYVGHKYCVDGFVKACLTYLEKSFSVENVLVLYEQAYNFGMSDLQQLCLRFIAYHAEQVLRSEELLAISDKTLVALLDRDDLVADEKSVFEAAVKWAKDQCAKKEEDESPDNIRRCLGDAFHRIRLPTMSIQDLADTVGPSKLLSEKEEVQLYRYIATASNAGSKNANFGKYKADKRKPRYAEVNLKKKKSLFSSGHFGSSCVFLPTTSKIHISIALPKGSAPVKLHSVSGSMFRYGVKELKQNGIAVATEKWRVEGCKVIIHGGVEMNTAGVKTDVVCVLANNETCAGNEEASADFAIFGKNVEIKYGTYAEDTLESLTFIAY